MVPPTPGSRSVVFRTDRIKPSAFRRTSDNCPFVKLLPFWQRPTVLAAAPIAPEKGVSRA
jgi:hypothetical protein